MNIDTVKANVSNVDLYDPQFIKNETKRWLRNQTECQKIYTVFPRMPEKKLSLLHYEKMANIKCIHSRKFNV